MEMIKDLYDYKGCKIRLTTDDGIYVGILKFLSSDILKVCLSNVVLLPQGTPILGLQTFFAHEIREYAIVSSPIDDGENTSKIKERNAADLEVMTSGNKNENIADYLDGECNAYPSEDGDITQNELEEDGEYVLKLPEHLVDDLPSDQIIIDLINDEFYEAIKHIKRQKLIGVGFEGELIGRYGDLCWLTVSTKFCTFLFDVFTLGTVIFEKGLKEILESSEIVKVIHDCRQPSDALYHQFNTDLNNVFDTQVGEVFADMQNSKPGKVGRHVKSLPNCLMRYLNLKPAQLYAENLIHSVINGALSEWKYRPLPNSLRDRAIKNVVFLRLLKEKLMDAMLTSFYCATDVYLNVVRNASAKELELEPSVPNLLPESLLSAGLQTFHMNKFSSHTSERKNVREVPCPDLNPIEEYLRHVKKYEVMEAIMNAKDSKLGTSKKKWNDKKTTSFDNECHQGAKYYTKCLSKTSKEVERILKLQMKAPLSSKGELSQCVSDCSRKEQKLASSETVNSEDKLVDCATKESQPFDERHILGNGSHLEEQEFEWPTVKTGNQTHSVKFLPAGSPITYDGKRSV